MDLNLVRSSLRRSENTVNHLYLCSKGHVTCAVGHLVPTLKDALELPLLPHEAIVHDWEAVSASKPGMRLARYREITTARMPDYAIDALLDTDINKRIVPIRCAIKGFDTFPDPIQRALFDMQYNMGLGFVTPKSDHYWPAFSAALFKRDWKTCAKECHRRDVSEARNKETEALFLSV